MVLGDLSETAGKAAGGIRRRASPPTGWFPEPTEPMLRHQQEGR